MLTLNQIEKKLTIKNNRESKKLAREYKSIVDYYFINARDTKTIIRCEKIQDILNYYL